MPASLRCRSASTVGKSSSKTRVPAGRVEAEGPHVVAGAQKHEIASAGADEFQDLQVEDAGSARRPCRPVAAIFSQNRAARATPCSPAIRALRGLDKQPSALRRARTPAINSAEETSLC